LISPVLLPPDWPGLPLDQVARLAPVQELRWPLFNDLGLEIAVKREDLLHPQLGGNKFYKLDGHLRSFRQSGADSLLSFGGAFSNHLYALAAAGRALKVPTIGVVRGERPTALSPTLEDAAALGMQLVFVSRAEYRRKEEPEWQAQLRERFAGAYWIPEGAGDLSGAAGCAVWAREALALAPWQADTICLAAGTGGTTAGVLAASPVPVHAFLALKGSPAELEATRSKILSQAQLLITPNSTNHGAPPSLFLESNYHCGGYARFPEALRQFAARFEADTGLPLDPVYTAKLFWGMAHKAQSGFWRPGTRILVMHTGGLQGRRGFVIQ
jgi:1-aminocyclopropane-1-carboxylate deaminase